MPFSDEHSGLLIDTARVIDAIDQEITDSNERKKELYAEVKEEVPPETFKAWKDAIKLRRKRRADRDACERHDEAVWRLVNLLEASDAQDEAENPPTATAAPANGIVEETAPTRAGAQAHDARETTDWIDPETGEIFGSVDDAFRPAVLHNPPAAAPAEPDLTIPACLDRRAREVAA